MATEEQIDLVNPEPNPGDGDSNIVIQPGVTLTGKRPKNTYKGLLKTSDSTNVTSALKVVSDGEGNNSALAISTTEISVAGVSSNVWNQAASRAGGFVHSQNVPASTWSVTHNLDKRPSVTIVDSGESVVVGDVQYTDNNSVVLVFTAAFSGKAYFN